jgi:hypothetical protein
MTYQNESMCGVRVIAMLSTMGACLAQHYHLPNNTKVDLPDPSIMQVVNYGDTLPPVAGGPKFAETVVEVLPCDCVDAAETLLAEGYNPAILNMANAKHPGGGWK